jgi:O-antigen ligase
LIAAITVLIGAGARMPLLIAAGLTITVLCFPFVTRWIAQGAVMLAAVSAFVLLSISTFIQSAVNPLISLALDRDAQTGPSDALNGRDFIWARSIDYWFDRVNDLPHTLLGFGVNGHYLSGASVTYSDRFSKVIRNPELASMHNSLLQQLFDGGILGWVLLIGAMYWASARLAKHRRKWGNAGLSAIVAMTALILSGITEISLAPGATHETFWLLMVLVGVACQASDDHPGSISSSPRGHDVAAAQ